MPSPSRKLATIAILVVLAALTALSALWWLRGDPGEAVAEPAPAVSAPGQASLTPPLDTTGDGLREAATEPAETPVADPEASPAAPDGPRVVVVVTDTKRQPVPGALVEITRNGPLGTHAAGDAGTCPLPLAPARDNVDLRVSATGFVPACLRTNRAERIEVVLRRSADVRGRVVTAESGSPVAGARVTLQSFGCGEPAPETVTDAIGRFELRGLPLEQELHWRIRAEGFATLEREMELRDPSLVVELALVQGVTLELLVTDAQTGAPIEGATISRGSTELLTDARGSVETRALLSVDDGETRLRVRAPGYCSLRARVRAAELDPGAPVRLPLLAGVRLEGRVLESGGAPAAGVLVHLNHDSTWRMRAGEGPLGARELGELPEQWSLQGRLFADAVSDEAGRLEYEGLEPSSGGYRLRVLGEAGRIADWQQVPPLGPPGSTTRVDIVLPAPDTGVVTGTMTLNGSPVPGSIGWRGPTRRGSAQVDASGGFRAENVEPGRVTLRPQPEGLVGFTGCRDLFSGMWFAEVTADTETRVDIALELELAPISGRVVDASGVPRAGLNVLAFSRDACWNDWSLQTGTDGAFELSVRAGPWGYRVMAGQYPDAVELQDVMAGTRDLELVLPGSGTLRLRVVDRRTREPLTGFALNLEDEQGRSHVLHDYFDRAFTPDPLGWYEPELRPGIWRLFVGDYPLGGVSGYLPLDGGEVRVQAGGPPVEVELERERGLELEVRLAAGQEPWPEELFVLLLEADLCDQVELGPNGWQIGQDLRGLNVVESRRIRPDSEGRASARALRPGRCRFVSFPDTIAIEPSEILVTGAETEPVELRWTPR